MLGISIDEAVFLRWTKWNTGLDWGCFSLGWMPHGTSRGAKHSLNCQMCVLVWK